MYRSYGTSSEHITSTTLYNFRITSYNVCYTKLLRWLHFETTYATVVGKQQNGDYLPFVPAHKLKFELRAEKDKLGVV